MTNETDILKILKVISDCDMHEDLWWRCDGKYAPITFFINCNDLFYWGTANLEEINMDNLAMLEQAKRDCEKIDKLLGSLYIDQLFCCRCRGMRPQRAAYPKDKRFRALFDACGQENNDET